MPIFPAEFKTSPDRVRETLSQKQKLKTEVVAQEVKAHLRNATP
jgi:hypothetical protein